MTVQKYYSKKQKAKKASSVPKSKLLGHKAIKSLLKLTKVVKTNLVRKYLRKLKIEKDNDEASATKIMKQIEDLKV